MLRYDDLKYLESSVPSGVKLTDRHGTRMLGYFQEPLGSRP
jgi:hypothetical protein